MSETRSTLERELERLSPPRIPLDQLVRRRDRKLRNERIRAGIVALGLVIAVGWLGLDAIRSTPSVPADPPSEGLGIFAPVAGRILFENQWDGSNSDVLAVDPDGPIDTVEGPTVADDVAATLVPLELDGEPLGWSRDGTELLFTRSTGDLIVQTFLFVLHADGSETRLTEDPMTFGGSAAFTPDGRVVFVAGDGLYVVDADGGQPEPIGTIPGEAVTWSPDGTQIAYLAGNRDAEVWVANADGTDAHEILADEPTELRGITGLEWSPVGDRLAIGVGTHQRSGGSIYTFAPDGSDFTRVIVGGSSPHWSPDGSQIAFTVQCDQDAASTCVQFDPQAGLRPAGLAIADADGSNVRAFGFAASGPWHPGTDRAREGEGVLDPTPDVGDFVHGWPGAGRNPPGLYSWNVPSGDQLLSGMHNGYGSGDVEIWIEVVPDDEFIPDDGATAVTVAGHDGIYRRIDAGREEWIVGVDGKTIAIHLEARPGTSASDLADAHAIIGSLRTEPRPNDPGFRLVFTLTTNDWDSG